MKVRDTELMRSRASRLEKTRATRRRRGVALGAVGAVGIASIAIAVALATLGPHTRSVELAEPTLPASVAAPAEASVPATTAVMPVEVPDVTRMTLDSARMLLETAGFLVVASETPSGEVASGTVVAQEPAAGTRVASGVEVAIVYAGTPRAGAPAAVSRGRRVVCLDPGHQQRANTEREPVGPGSKEMKAKVTGGAVGVVTRTPEYELTLAVAQLVKTRLEAQGVTVVMTRVVNTVDISNRQRAEVANAAGADLFVRIHADSHTNAALKGVSILYPSGNEWVTPVERQSLTAATMMRSSVIAATGAEDRGIVKRSDLSGFNWAKVPSVLIEMGFMSNPVEDELLATDAYRAKLADGITAGILGYLDR